MTFSTISYFRLQELFDREKIDYEKVMEYLLYRISPMEFYPSLMSDSGVDGVSCTNILYVKDTSQAVERLPKYLGGHYSVEQMKSIEAKLQRLELALQEYQATPREKLWKKLKAWLKYNALRRKRTSIQNAFNYLEYRASSDIGIASLRQKFMAFAEEFSKPKELIFG